VLWTRRMGSVLLEERTQAIIDTWLLLIIAMCIDLLNTGMVLQEV